ncbi:MAG: type II toxin-antitoxin system HicB family antitoxin [Parcubacteria group bacterium]
MKAKTVKLQYVVWKEGKYFVSRCLNVEVSSFGKTKEEAIKNLKEAIALYFDGTDSKRITKVERPILITGTFQYV